jgi:hypothetical protein
MEGITGDFASLSPIAPGVFCQTCVDFSDRITAMSGTDFVVGYNPRSSKDHSFTGALLDEYVPISRLFDRICSADISKADKFHCRKAFEAIQFAAIEKAYEVCIATEYKLLAEINAMASSGQFGDLTAREKMKNDMAKKCNFIFAYAAGVLISDKISIQSKLKCQNVINSIRGTFTLKYGDRQRN